MWCCASHPLCCSIPSQAKRYDTFDQHRVHVSRHSPCAKLCIGGCPLLLRWAWGLPARICALPNHHAQHRVTKDAWYLMPVQLITTAFAPPGTSIPPCLPPTLRPRLPYRACHPFSAPRTIRPQVRCLVDVPGEKLPEDLPAYLRATVAPQLPEELRPAFLTALEAEPIRSMQNKQLTSQPLHQPGMTGRLAWCWSCRRPCNALYQLGQPISQPVQQAPVKLSSSRPSRRRARAARRLVAGPMVAMSGGWPAPNSCRMLYALSTPFFRLRDCCLT